MPTERVIEIPWALGQLPQSGTILDVGSCDATYLGTIIQSDRLLHCMDPRDCRASIPAAATFFHDDLIGNKLPRAHYDAVLVLSVIEHIGLPTYGQDPFPNGDVLALAEVAELLKPGAPAIFTVPAGQSKVMSWYRQYSPVALQRLFADWHTEISYWGFDGRRYIPIAEDQVERYDYRDRFDEHAGGGALAGIIARVQ